MTEPTSTDPLAEIERLTDALAATEGRLLARAKRADRAEAKVVRLRAQLAETKSELADAKRQRNGAAMRADRAESALREALR